MEFASDHWVRPFNTDIQTDAVTERRVPPDKAFQAFVEARDTLFVLSADTRELVGLDVRVARGAAVRTHASAVRPNPLQIPSDGCLAAGIQILIRTTTLTETVPCRHATEVRFTI